MPNTGYGKVYQSVMRDPDLPAEAKAVYAYLSSIAGEKNECFPSIDLMQHELHMGRKRLSKYLDQLIQSGIIRKKRQRSGNLWGKNVYMIDHRCGNFETVENRSVENETVENRSVENEATIKNSLKINNVNNNIICRQVVDLYNSFCKSFPKVLKLSESRRKSITARINAGYTLDDFKHLFQNAEQSEFLKGSNDRNWIADFDWLIADRNFTRVLEGKYDNKKGTFEKNEESNTGFKLFS